MAEDLLLNQTEEENVEERDSAATGVVSEDVEQPVETDGQADGTPVEDPGCDAEEKAPEPLVLRSEGLVKMYGKRTVVNDVSFNVKQGEIVGLLGPNGAGKTTTFYMTTGLITANSGHIFLNDEDITGFPMYKRAQMGIGYLPQEASVFRKMTVEDNILSVLEMTNFTKEYQKQKLAPSIQRSMSQTHMQPMQLG